MRFLKSANKQKRQFAKSVHILHKKRKSVKQIFSQMVLDEFHKLVRIVFVFQKEKKINKEIL